MKKLHLRLISAVLGVILAVSFPAYVSAANIKYFDSPAISNSDKGIVKSSMFMYVGSPKAIANNSEEYIDAANRVIVPIVENGVTLVPVGFIASYFGAALNWNGALRKATLTFPDKTIEIPIGTKSVYVNGKQYTTEVESRTIDGRTYVPLRIISESLGYYAKYYNKLIIISPSDSVNRIENTYLDFLITKFATSKLYDTDKINASFNYMSQNMRDRERQIVENFITKETRSMDEMKKIIDYFFSACLDEFDIDFRRCSWVIEDMSGASSGLATFSWSYINGIITDYSLVMHIDRETVDKALSDTHLATYVIAVILHESYHGYSYLKNTSPLASALFHMENVVTSQYPAYYNDNYHDLLSEMAAYIYEGFMAGTMIGKVSPKIDISHIESLRKYAETLLPKIYSRTNTDPRNKNTYEAATMQYNMATEILAKDPSKLSAVSELNWIFKNVEGKVYPRTYEDILLYAEQRIKSARTAFEREEIMNTAYNLPFYMNIACPQYDLLRQTAADYTSGRKTFTNSPYIEDYIYLVRPTKAAMNSVSTQILGRNIIP